MRRRIDSHIHWRGDTPESLALLDELNLKCLNICVAGGSTGDTWYSTQRVAYRELAKNHPNHYAWCTSFNLPEFDNPDYIEQTITRLDEDFAAGAIACKAWKNIGMDVKKPDGSFMQIDDMYFDPIFKHLEKNGRTMIMHIAEPLSCWRPLDDPADPHYGYYKNNPQWHMYGKDDNPSHEEINAAWERMIGRYPGMTIVGAHLGAQEYDVREVAKRMDKFPNYHVDTSARMPDMAFRDVTRVREFFAQYSDRILYGIDIGCPSHAAMSDAERSESLKTLKDAQLEHYGYFENSGEVEVRGRTVAGLALPEDILEQLYRRNAERCFPGI